jgi:type II secretory pathway component PulK
MKIKHPASNIQRPTPNGVGRRGLLDVRRLMLDVGCSERGSVLVIVLWVCLGLVTIALYFANSMTYELRAADNRVSGISAEQAIEGAQRYVSYFLANYSTNGVFPTNANFTCENVAIGDAHYWIIGRDPNGDDPNNLHFGLIDEASKLNLNTANTNALSYLPNMTMDFAQAILDWRGTNGTASLDYTSSGYVSKNAAFETVDELRLVYGADLNLLAGDDLNRNGVLDPNEKSTTGTGQLNSGLFEYTTVYTREPNFHSDGTMLTNVTGLSGRQLTALFQNAGISGPASMVQSVTNSVARLGAYKGILDFAVRCRQAGMTAAQFANLATNITTTTNTYVYGRVNVNTADEDVLTALFEGLNNGNEQTAEADAQTIINYRQQNSSLLTSVAWLYDALGTGNSTLQYLQRGDYVTTKSFQFTADIAAVGAYGRGYRRVKFIFDISDGTPKIIYRQDLSRLGWALGDKIRQTTLLANNTQ